MSKTILLIESDAPFAEEMSGALEAMGYQVRVTGDGKEGLDLAKDLRPDAIVLCVELPRLSGYSICNKLKKDEALRAIPLVLTSSEATDEVFEDHRKLKVKAEEYLIKPYVSAALLEKVAGLIGMPGGGASLEPPPASMSAPGADGGDEEVVSLEEELGFEAFAGQPGEDLPALDLDSLPDEPSAGTGDAALDSDLKLLDDAFDGLSAPAAAPAAPRTARAAPPQGSADGIDARVAEEAIEKAMGVDRPVTSEDLEAATASLPEDDEVGPGPDLGDLTEEADLALGALDDMPPASSAFDVLDALDGFDEPSPAPSVTARPASPGFPVRAAAVVAAAGAVVPAATEFAAGAAVAAGGASVAELARLEAELAERRAALNSLQAELAESKAKLAAATRRAEEADSTLGEKDAEAASLKARGDALAAQAKKSEAEVRAAREEGRRAAEQSRAAELRAEGAEARAASAEARISSADGRARAAEQEAATQRRAAEQGAAALAAKAAELVAALAASARQSDLEATVDRLESELVEARGELAGTRSEVEKRAADLKRRIGELETANAKNEERVVKAYLKIKGDEKVRDKARKALSIALQLLEEGLPAEPAGEKRPHPSLPVPE